MLSRNAECHISFIVVLSVVMLNVVTEAREKITTNLESLEFLLKFFKLNLKTMTFN